MVRPATLAAALIVAFLLLVASKVARSPAPGTARPDQFAASVQLLVRPRPVHVRVAPWAGPETETPRNMATAMASRTTRGARADEVTSLHALGAGWTVGGWLGGARPGQAHGPP